jgi:hypothetical protein
MRYVVSMGREGANVKTQREARLQRRVAYAVVLARFVVLSVWAGLLLVQLWRWAT